MPLPRSLFVVRHQLAEIANTVELCAAKVGRSGELRILETDLGLNSASLNSALWKTLPSKLVNGGNAALPIGALF